MDKKVAIGYTKKTFGVGGELRLSIDPEYVEDMMKATIFFLEIKGKPVPYFVESIRFSNTPIVKFEDINTPEAARKLSSSKILLRETDMLPEADRLFEVEELEFEKYVGFTITDEKNGLLGKIIRIEEFPQQEMAIIQYNDKEIMIPMNDKLIAEINEDQQQITVVLPDGLLELY